jgi:glycosyltransferase involved in cell wall biosynthesis
VRLVLVSANFRPHVGGIERFVEILAGGLAERGHDVDVVCCRYGGAALREELDGFTVHRIPSSYVLDRRVNVPFPVPEPVTMLRVLRREISNADVVHVQDAIYATSFTALVLARRGHVASVLTQHVAFVPQGSRALDAVQYAAHATLGRSARLATVVATLSPAVADWVRGSLGVREPRVLPVGVPAVLSAPNRVELRRSFRLPADRFVALFIGRDVPKKGLDFFLGAADPAYELVAVTDRAGGAPGTTILPFMSAERVQDLLECVDAVVLPSEGEGFPLALQEALAKGLPVVTTWQAGYEHYLDPDDVVVIERASRAVREALLRLVEDGGLRAALGERSRAAAERSFDVDRFVSAYEEAYEEARSLLGQGPARNPAPRRRRPNRPGG